MRFGLKGCPLNGDPSASQACFKASSWLYYSVVGNPICFLCCSYIIFRIAPCVSPSNSWRGFVLLTFEVSIYGSPLNTVPHIFSSAFSRLRLINVLFPDRSIFQTDSEELIFSYRSPSIITYPVFFRIEILSFLSFTSSWILYEVPFSLLG